MSGRNKAGKRALRRLTSRKGHRFYIVVSSNSLGEGWDEKTKGKFKVGNHTTWNPAYGWKLATSPDEIAWLNSDEIVGTYDNAAGRTEAWDQHVMATGDTSCRYSKYKIQFCHVLAIFEVLTPDLLKLHNGGAKRDSCWTGEQDIQQGFLEKIFWREKPEGGTQTLPHYAPFLLEDVNSQTTGNSQLVRPSSMSEDNTQEKFRRGSSCKSLTTSSLQQSESDNKRKRSDDLSQLDVQLELKQKQLEELKAQLAEFRVQRVLETTSQDEDTFQNEETLKDIAKVLLKPIMVELGVFSDLLWRLQEEVQELRKEVKSKESVNYIQSDQSKRRESVDLVTIKEEEK